MPLHWDWKPDSTTCCNKESGRYYGLLRHKAAHKIQRSTTKAQV